MAKRLPFSPSPLGVDVDPMAKGLPFSPSPLGAGVAGRQLDRLVP